MYQTGTASGYQDLLNKLNAFLTDTGSAWGVRRTGVGNGRLVNYSGGAASVAESFTLTATSPTTFSVVGSTSGALGTATVGQAFDTAQLKLTVQVGATAFAVGDTFSLVTAPKWTALRAEAGAEYIWQAPGADGASAIYVGAKSISNVGADVYNLSLQGFTGYDAAAAFDAQPGAITSTDKPGLALWQSNIPYWFVADGRRVVVVAKVSTSYQSAYLGLIEQYVDPLAYPYALAVGGTVNGALRFSDTSTASNAFPMASVDSVANINSKSQLRLRAPSGAWLGFVASVASAAAYASDAGIWPYQVGMTALRPNLDGTYPLVPVILHDVTPNVYGQLGGVRATTGFGTGAESVITDGDDQYLVVQNGGRTATNQYFALHLN